MRLIWFSWKDATNPLAGGAEVVTDELLGRMAAEGHEVILLTAGYKGSSPESERKGYRIIRAGGRWTVYWHAFRYYRAHMAGWADVVVEEINTIPFFTQWYVRAHKRLLFIHQLAREIWFYQMPFPLSLAGYAAEPVYLRLLRRNDVVTISESTAKDLRRVGFRAGRIRIISEGIQMDPVPDLSQAERKEGLGLLSLGAIRPMKRTLDQVRAFELARQSVPGLRLTIAGAGEGPYFERVMKAVRESPFRDDIEYLGRVSPQEKARLMGSARLILVTSVKEGWGLIVTEAASQGTPAVVYDADGLRDSVQDGVTGLVCRPANPSVMARQIIRACTEDALYARLRKQAWEQSRSVTFERAYEGFRKEVGLEAYQGRQESPCVGTR